MGGLLSLKTMNNVKKVIAFIFDKTPFLRAFVKFILDELAAFAIYISHKIGTLYTALFGFLGTSWFDHKYDYLKGIRNYYWLERAFFTLPKISKDSSVLDIGCGDGIYSGIFYSSKAKNVLGVDINLDAIIKARQNYKNENVKFQKKDVLTWDIPSNSYNLVTMFAVIEHFTEDQGLMVIKKIKKSLKKNGVFYGSTPILKQHGIANWEHKNEFESGEILESFLRKVFRKVTITESTWNKERSECYFECRV